MTTTVQISLPLEQLELLNRVESLLLKNLEEANRLTLLESCDRLKVKNAKSIGHLGVQTKRKVKCINLCK